MNNKNSSGHSELNYETKGLIAVAVFIGLAVAFYFLAGEQLHFCESKGNLAMPSADTWSEEISIDYTYEQIFQVKIQRLESISVLWGNCDRENSGTLMVELSRVDNGTTLMQKQFNCAELSNFQTLSLVPESPIETVYDTPLRLRLSSNSEPGTVGLPLICKTPSEQCISLTLNGKPLDGMLCFSASGKDHVWIGQHYWELTIALGLFIAQMLFLMYMRTRSGKRSYIVNAIIALNKYRFLIRQLVSRDFKTKYKRSILGVLWSFLNPLLMMLVQYYVFSTIFMPDVAYFAAYLIIGTVMFNFFSESVGLALTSILSNASLITKVYMPKYIYPLTRVLSSLVNLLISLIPMLIVCLITGVHLKKSAILALFFMCFLVIFCLGVGLVLATSMVFFRDTQFLWNVLNMMWMYATPIFYPETILPENLRGILMINPMYHFIKNTRICILDGVSPEPMAYITCMLIAVGVLLIGAFIFKKEQDKFVLYL